jgi:putative polyketide hydroxylase
VLFRAPLWPLVGAHRHGLYMITHPEADVALLPAGRGDRWIYAVSYDPGIEAPGDFGPERLTRMLRLATGDPALAPRYESVAGVTFGAHLAERFREGRVLLVGDAAHRVTPRGGTGLNSALKGGVDVGWKLAWILSGWAPEALIDTYETERRPVVQHNLERSIDPEGSIREPGAEIAADLGGRVKHVWTEGRSTVDLLGPGYTLFAAPAAPGRPRGIPAGPPVKRVALDPGAARELGLGTAGTLLARPDGVPVGLWPGAASGLAGPQGVLGHERVVVGVEAADDLPADALEGHAV